jgi:hypothetical protein
MQWDEIRMDEPLQNILSTRFKYQNFFSLWNSNPQASSSVKKSEKAMPGPERKFECQNLIRRASSTVMTVVTVVTVMTVVTVATMVTVQLMVTGQLMVTVQW